MQFEEWYLGRGHTTYILQLEDRRWPMYNQQAMHMSRYGQTTTILFCMNFLISYLLLSWKGSPLVHAVFQHMIWIHSICSAAPRKTVSPNYMHWGMLIWVQSLSKRTTRIWSTFCTCSAIDVTLEIFMGSLQFLAFSIKMTREDTSFKGRCLDDHEMYACSCVTQLSSRCELLLTNQEMINECEKIICGTKSSATFSNATQKHNKAEAYSKSIQVTATSLHLLH